MGRHAPAFALGMIVFASVLARCGRPERTTSSRSKGRSHAESSEPALSEVAQPPDSKNRVAPPSTTAEIGEEDPLESALHTSDADLRATAISRVDLDEALAGPSIGLLWELLQDRSERMRHVALDALPLPRRRRTDCVTLLADAYRREDSTNVRTHLLEAIHRIGGEEARLAITVLTGCRPEQDP